MKGLLKIKDSSSGNTKELNVDLFSQSESDELRELIERVNNDSTPITLEFEEDSSTVVDSIDEIYQEVYKTTYE